jgi:uncharacterized membrane protein YgaE (UPF0421/DUF939 family)
MQSKLPPYLPILKRALKAAVAAALATIYYKLLNLPEGYWAVISAIIVMESSVQDSIRLSWFRFAGTAIGAVVGLVSVLVLGATPWSIGIAILTTTLVCTVLNLPESYRLAGVTAAIVILASRTNPGEFALQRFTDVSVGILIALLVSILIFPEKHLRSDELKESFEKHD